MKPIKLKYKITAIGVILFAFFSIYFLFIINYLINQEYEGLEKNQLIQKYKTVLSLIDFDVDKLNTTARDYAVWDDAYNFIKTKDQSFINSNFTIFSLRSLKLNLILIDNLDNETIYKIYYDYYNSKEKIFPEDFQNRLGKITKEVKVANKNYFKGGLISTPDGAMILSVSSISDSLKSQPINGVLFFGTIVDTHLTEEYSLFIGQKIELVAYDSNNLDVNYLAAKNSLTKSDYFFVNDYGRLYLYGIINGLENQPVLIVKIESSSNYFGQSQNILNWLTLNLFIINLLFVGAFIVVIYILTINRVNNYSKQIESFDLVRGDLSDIKLFAEDEIADLGKKINFLISRFRKNQAKQKKINDDLIYENAELEAINEKLINQSMGQAISEKRLVQEKEGNNKE